MTGNQDQVLLMLVLITVLANLALGIVLWWRQASLGARVARLEVYREHAISQVETRQIYERLASIEGQIQTTNRLMQTVQQHLLESDR